LPSISHLVHSIWTIESVSGIPSQEMNVGVPTGRPKFLLPVLGELNIKTANNKENTAKINTITFAGLMDKPVTLSSSENISMIGIDFSPLLASKIFKCPLNELTNEIYSLNDLLGSYPSDLQNRLNQEDSLKRKIEMLQDFLAYKISSNNHNDTIIEFAVSYIYQHKGNININQLCKKLGYSKRYLDIKFLEKIGVSPKLFASITRFQYLYKTLLQSTKSGKDLNFYDFYFDQSHFIKDFKRFTGSTPYAYMKAKNNFAEMFYK